MKFWQKAKSAANKRELTRIRIRGFPIRVYSRSFAALCLLALGLAAQTVTTGDPAHTRVRAIGEKLKCQCSCPYTVGSCNMLHCHSKEEIDEQVKADLNAGLSEDAIFAKLKAKYGTIILNAPPAQGFNLVGWIMPFAALLLGLLVIRYFLARWRRPRPAPAASGAPVERFHDEIEKELADLE